MGVTCMNGRKKGKKRWVYERWNRNWTTKIGKKDEG